MRYLFCTPSSAGLLGPSLVIANELRHRGHTVAFATGKSMRGLLAQADLERIPYGPNDGESFEARNIWKVPEVIHQAKHTMYACQEFAPDVLVGQTLTWGTMAFGASAHLPLAIVGQAGYIWPTETIQPCYQRYAPAFVPHVYERYKMALSMYKMCCNVLKIPCPDAPYRETPFTGDLFLLQSVPALEGDPTLLPEHVHLVGDCTWNPDQTSSELQDWLEESQARKQPVVYLQIGRVLHSTEYLRDLIDELGQRPVRVVASLGGASSEVATVPENFFVRDLILQGQVLPYASAVICSGTSTNVLGAATAGLPILIITANSEEPTDLAVRCAQAGFGLYLDHQKATSQAVRDNVTALLEKPELALAAQHVRRAFASTQGPRGAAALLERLGRNRKPLSRVSTDQEMLASVR